MKKIQLIFQLSIIVIFQIQAQLDITGPNELCENGMGSYSVSGGTMPYNWDVPPSVTVSPSMGTNVTITAGTNNFIITVTDANGSTTKAVAVNSKPTLAMTSNSPICEGLTLNLDCGFSGATSYIWAGPSGFTSNIKNPTRPNATPGMTGAYNVTVTDGNSCTNVGSIMVTVNAKPTLAMTSNSPICEGLTLNLDCGFSGATSYIWAGPSSFTSNIKNPTRPNATPGMTGAYNVTVTDGNSCSKTDIIQINVKILPTSPTIIDPIKSICKNGTVKFSASGCNSGKVEWYDNMSGSGNPISLQNDIEDVPQKSKKYYAFCRSNDCLSAQGAEAQVTVFDNPNPGQISSTPQLDPIHVCDESTIKLNSSGVQGGIWSVSNFNVANIDSNSGLLRGINQGSVTVTYQVKDTHQNLTCTAETFKDVRIDENPIAAIIGDQDVCIGKDAKLQAEVKTGALPFKFLWNTTETSKEIDINSITESKSYLVTVTDYNSCSVVSTYKLIALDTPKIVFNLSTPINNTQVIQIEDKSIPNNSIKSFELKVKNVVTKVEKIISNFDPSGKYNFANLAYGTYEVCLKIINNSMCEGYYCKNYLLQDTACYGIVQASLDRVIPKYCIGDTVKIKLHVDFNKFDFSRKFPVCQVFNNVNLIYSKEFSATIKDFDTTILIPVDQPNSFNLVSSISGLDFSGISISCSDAKNYVVNNKPSLLLEDSIFCSKLDGIENIKIRFKINDDKGNISKTDPFSYEFNGSSKKVNDTFSIDQTFKSDTLQIMRCIDLTNITNNSTTCSIDPLPECIILNKSPIFNLKDSSFCSGTKVKISLKDFTFDTTNIIFSWRAADDSFKNIKQIVIDKVKEGSQSFFYKISNINDVNCYSEAKIDFDGLKSPEIRDLESLFNCSGLIKLNLKIGEISKLDSVIWSSNHPKTTELIPILKDIVLVKSKSAQENIGCIINIGSCADTMSINLSNFPVVDTSYNLIKSIICKDSTLLYTNLSKCYSWYFIDPDGKIKVLMDTTPYIVFNTKMLDSSKFFISTYDCNSGACDTTALFSRSSSNEEHCQDFLHPNVKLFPNPNNGSFTLIVDEFPPGLYLLKVFDLLGRELYQSESVLNSKNAKLDYQLESNLASGMYLVSFGNGSGIRFTIPILITK